MFGKYAYSLNGEHYRGSFQTRDEAVVEAFDSARRSPQAPQTVYVGRIVPGDPKAGGHARAVLSNMAARAREEFGDAGLQYLQHLSKQQIDSLDDALELVVRGWLHRHDLMPTFFKVDAIGEYPVPASSTSSRQSSESEVQEIGSGEYEM
jgi:hypothetical protein